MLFCLSNAVDEIVANLDQTAALGGTGAQKGAADAGVFVDTGGALGACAGADGELAAFEVAEEVLPLGVGGGAVFLCWPQGATPGDEGANAWSRRERLGLLRVRGTTIVLYAMRWPDEVRNPAAVDPPNESVSQEEIEQALALIDHMTQDDLEGPEFTDAYTDALTKVIEAKREDKHLPDAPEPEQPGKVLDLMAVL
ncbi:hypothetical protein AB0O75_50150 [Streptomyces sp. NPDC088921]|uniref:hypothetical protein n=1 Tax=unclassified Streptomyces TaxID=2593676 RepID=UPI003418D533